MLINKIDDIAEIRHLAFLNLVQSSLRPLIEYAKLKKYRTYHRHICIHSDKYIGAPEFLNRNSRKVIELSPFTEKSELL